MVGALITYLILLRKKYHKSQNDVARGMEDNDVPISTDALRHIERGRRPLPDFMHGRVRWVRAYLKSLGDRVTKEEEEKALKLTYASFVDEFADWLKDLQRRD